ncbi:hypothetical protein WDU94_006008 [Cyamophila willieti]
MKDKPKAECLNSPRRLRSSLVRIESRKIDLIDNKNNIKTEISTKDEVCIGFQVSKVELDQIQLKKDLLQSRINTLDKYLDPSIKSKEWRQGEEGEDEKVTEIRKRRPKQRRLTETEVMQRLAGKRKRSEEAAVEEKVSPIKKDGRGRPKGWRKVKEEVVDDSAKGSTKVAEKLIAKRRKKDELLLLKALDEEMLKMDEDNTKEIERISQGLDYQCSVCSQVFIEKINLSKHFFKCLMKFTQSGRSSFKCAICFEYFSLLESLEAHVSRKHDGICEEPFQCSVCSLCFGEASALKTHVLEKHDVFQCRYCSKYYRNQYTLDVHLSKKHPGENRDNKPNTTNIVTVTPGHAVTSTRHTRGKAAINTIKQERTEPPQVTTSQPNSNEPRKKLGRPFKRKSSDDQSSGAQLVIKSEERLGVNIEVPKMEAVPAYATPSKRGTESGEKIPPVTPEENIELGRGRRVKKKKALDYEDSISTTPGRRVRKSTDTLIGQIGQSTPNYERQSAEASRTNGLIGQTLQIDDLKTDPNDSRPVQNRSSSKNHQIPQPIIIQLKNIQQPKNIQPELISGVDKCSKGTNDDSGPVWKTFPPYSTLSTSKSENLSQSIDEDNTKVTDPSEQPIQQSVESSVYLNRKVHLCPKCRKSFPNKYLVKVHMKRRHNIFKRKTVIVPQNGDQESGDNGASGPISGRDYNQSPRSRPCTGNRETLFKCALCDASFPTFYSLEDHYLRVHEGIPCGVCRIRIKNRMLLDKHLNACHGPEERYMCPVCDKRMKSKETLRKHIVMHEDRRPYDCFVCKRSFRYSYDMRLHMRRTHPKEFARTQGENATVVGEEETAAAGGE